MAFLSSYTGNNRRGSGWSNSILPTSITKSKLPRNVKSRRRTSLLDFLFSNFFCIRYSNPLSSTKFHTNFRSRKPINYRKPINSTSFAPSVGAVVEIIVVPHSHNDPGWKLTVEQYYDQQSRHILDTIVDSLSKDVRRKFIWEEMSYLERWWRDASQAKKESFTNLVKNRQLEIVGGGWVMNDEANSHYFAIIEQMTEGNMWLNETIGLVPKNAWAIDPLGYSPTMAYLLRRMVFENMLTQRTHYELKKELALHKNLEKPLTSLYMMPFYSYDVPHTCGPDPAVCCQFDFARMRGFMYELCPCGQHPVETDVDNVKERALTLLDQCKKKSTLYRTNTLLIPLGDDFRYISIDEAEAQFRNYQMLFDFINSNPDFNAEAKFGTLEDYFGTLREESERINYSLPGEIGSVQVGGFPSLSGDFFTYADRQQDYWSGYYVSRPFFKAVDRVLEQTLRASEVMLAFVPENCLRASCEKFPTNFSYKFTAAKRNLALFQHHDGVTGTAKDHVGFYNGTLMHASLQDLQVFMSKSVEFLLGQVRSRYDVQPVHRAISALDGGAHSVTKIVMVIVDKPGVTVLDSNWTCVESQVVPEHRLYWRASVPALGLQTYYIANKFVGCEKAKQVKLKFITDSNLLPCPAPYACSRLEGEIAEIRTQRQTITFDAKLGLLHKISSTGIVTLVGEEISMYSSEGSGAYLFKPTGEAQPITRAGGQMVISEGPLMQEFLSYPKTEWTQSPISHSTRIYNGENTVQELLIEKEYHVELIGKDFNGKELITRFKADTDSKQIFCTGLNGFQMSRRETYDKIPLQGNYYPVPSLAFLQGSNGHRFSVHSQQSLGVASLKNGGLEIMLDRRLVRDDDRGLGQGVTDNRPMNVIFHILAESNISMSDPVSTPLPLNPSLLSHRVGSHLNYPMHTFISKKSQETSKQQPPRFFSPSAASLPCDLHIVNFKVPHPLRYFQQPPVDPRFVLMLQRRQWDSAYCRKGGTQCSKLAQEPVNLFNIFKDLDVVNARATSLNLLHDETEMLGYAEQLADADQEGHVSISPMEIQAYKLELKPHR
ncbi:hypothetical protein MKX01_040327 [Papaver californicum]|nr:hypothetical protein MKX01_040327 [Papaver californicum]